MKILILSDKPLWPASSGGALAIMASAQGLSQNGAMVDMLAAITEKHPASDNSINTNDFISGKYYTVKISTKIRSLKLLINLLFSKMPFNVERHKSLLYWQKIEELINKRRYDLVQLEGINSTVYIDQLRSIFKGKISYRAHNVESEIWKELGKGEKNRLKKWYYKILGSRLSKYEPEVIGKCDFLIPISNIDKEYFSFTGIKTPGMCCPYGIDIKDSHKTITKTRDIVYIGSLDWRPNQEGLIWFMNTVWNKISKSDRDIRFSVAGRNAPDWLKEKLKSANIDFLGEVKDASEFISSGKLLIIPLLSGSGIRVRIIESMSLGVPVITTKKGLQGIDAEPEEGVVCVKDSNSFYNEIILKLDDNKLRTESGKNARNYIKNHYCNKKLNRDLLRFYTKYTL